MAAAFPNTTPDHTSDEVESGSLRQAMRQFATGVTVVTTGRARYHGMTANSVSSVSLDPPMVLCCVGRTATMHEAIHLSRSFAVSVLAGDQAELAGYFTDRTRPRGRSQFDGVDWRPGPHTGAPLLGGCLAWLECELSEVHPGGDHSIFVGAVVSASWSTAREALLFFDGAFGSIAGDPR
ncbi:flavin reductase family protein [Saccharomonospora halophila]|uniref:flavin reductase family protein n=1 Tax=Saccharomonospora halophila TaxID=129922 RepID=UPI000382C30D|nr:flavin reductase family protein [Saccharomonospora halophila]